MDHTEHIGIQVCILYRNLEDGGLLETVSGLMAREEDPDTLYVQLCGITAQLVEMAGKYGLSGNLWHAYLTHLLVNHDNAYSRACEMRSGAAGSINTAALHDFRILKRLFDFPLEKLAREVGADYCDLLEHYVLSEGQGKSYNARICSRIAQLCGALEETEKPEDFMACVTAFYGEYGVGTFGLHKAFRVGENAQIIPINNVAHVHLDDLVGYEYAKQQLIENTEAFIAGRPSNNCLLYGDAGTGKSSSIKAIMNQYYDQGLRLIELYKHQFRDLNAVIAQIKNRNYRFIIYLDDLSFEEFETDYKYLKAVIEGDLEQRPDNIRIYATSNRRHLVRETTGDRSDADEDLHRSDTVQEKISLSARFGKQIYFGKPTPQEFRTMVKILAARQGVKMEEQELLREANKWEVAHGGYSGRAAQQFIDDLRGRGY